VAFPDHLPPDIRKFDARDYSRCSARRNSRRNFHATSEQCGGFPICVKNGYRGAMFGVRGSREREKERERERERRGYRSVRLNNSAASETFPRFPRLDFPRSDSGFRSWSRYRAPARLFLLLRGAGVETWPNNLSPSIRAFDGSDRS